MHVLDLRTGETRQLTPASASDRWPSWNGAGSRLLVLRRHGTTGPAHLVSVGQGVADSTRFVAVDQPDNSDPHWSPNGEAVVRARWPTAQVEVISLPSGAVVEIVPNNPGYQVRSPVWAPTGDRIAYSRFGPGDSSTVFVVSPSGAAISSVRVAGYPTQIAWEPGADRLAFCRYAGEWLGAQRFEVVIWDVGTPRVRSITPPDASDCQVSWGARPR
jgi:Tol biopolymer transport system component